MKVKNVLFSAVSLILGLSVLSACGGTSEGDGYTATFKYNYEGAPADYVQRVEKGGVAEPPSDPTRENYSFNGWFNEANCTTEADFEYTITSDVSYYAGWTQTVAVITYNPNYAGAVSATAKVDIGGKAAQPETPSRDGYVFDGWYTEASCTNEFSFDAAITSDLELFAGWEESTGDTVKVTFSYNYTGAGNYYTQTINTGRRVSKPADPDRTAEGYAFLGWYADAACLQSFNFNTFINENTTIYARWSKIHTFEAEYVDLTGKFGVGWSSSVEGRGMLDTESTASNGWFVGYMYVTGNKLTFNVTAKEDVDDCVLVLRLTAEGEQGAVVSLTDEELLVKVNDKKLDYATLVFDGIPDINGGTRRPFSNHTINTSVSLKKGENVIELIVNNSKNMGGTMNATAPMFDCMYIYTDAEIGWTEGKCFESNLDGLS